MFTIVHNFLNMVSDSTRLHNRMYGGHRITFTQFHFSSITQNIHKNQTSLGKAEQKRNILYKRLGLK